MALNLYGKTNYEVEVPLSLVYSREAAILPTVLQPNLETQYRYTRNATKTYNFRGMTEKAVKACLTVKRQQYMRRFMYWTLYAAYWHTPDEFTRAGEYSRVKPPYYSQVAQFDVTRTSEAPVFDLKITVNETIALYSIDDYDPNDPTMIASIEDLFLNMSYTPTALRLMGDNTGGPQYFSYLHEYSYDEGLTTDTIVP